MTFTMIKNLIIKQNEEFLKDLAIRFGRNPIIFLDKYIRPEYYLPLIESCNIPAPTRNKSSKTDLKSERLTNR